MRIGCLYQVCCIDGCDRMSRLSAPTVAKDKYNNVITTAKHSILSGQERQASTIRCQSSTSSSLSSFILVVPQLVPERMLT